MPPVRPAPPDAATILSDAVPARRGESTLQLVLSLLRLRLAHARTPEIANALTRTVDEIDTIVSAHHQLNAAGAERLLDPGSTLRALAERLAAATPSVTVEARLGPALVASRHLTPLLLMAHEALVNALRHGFPNGRTGVVALALEELPDSGTRLTVADNGVGLRRSPGFPDTGRRGALLLRQLARQSGFSLTVTGSPGVTVTIDLPPVNGDPQEGSK